MNNRRPSKYFVCSMGDLFHDDVPFRYIHEIWDVMKGSPQHIFMVLTKRPVRMKDAVELIYSKERLGWAKGFWSHVWLGVTAENQQRADERIPTLLQIPAAGRYVSIEPCLGPVDITPYIGAYTHECKCGFHRDESQLFFSGGKFLCLECGEITVDRKALDWVIVGCESGPNRRHMELEWAINIVEQCKTAGVPVFVKQIEVNGKVSHDMSEWPEELRVQEWPEVTHETHETHETLQTSRLPKADC